MTFWVGRPRCLRDVRDLFLLLVDVAMDKLDVPYWWRTRLYERWR